MHTDVQHLCAAAATWRQPHWPPRARAARARQLGAGEFGRQRPQMAATSSCAPPGALQYTRQVAASYSFTALLFASLRSTRSLVFGPTSRRFAFGPAGAHPTRALVYSTWASREVEKYCTVLHIVQYEYSTKMHSIISLQLSRDGFGFKKILRILVLGAKFATAWRGADSRATASSRLRTCSGLPLHRAGGRRLRVEYSCADHRLAARALLDGTSVVCSSDSTRHERRRSAHLPATRILQPEAKVRESRASHRISSQPVACVAHKRRGAARHSSAGGRMLCARGTRATPPPN